MKNLLRLALFTAVNVLLIGGAYLAWKNYRLRSGIASIPSTGGRPLAIRLPDVPATYLQSDPRWAKDPLGGTKQTLAGAGCLVCSVAMASTALGQPIDPGTLNRNLIANAGFTSSGWIVWGALPKATGGRVAAIISSSPTHAELDAALQRGDYPVVKFILPAGIPHWVIILGKDGTEYLARDPRFTTPTPVKLSTLTKTLYSLRIIRTTTSA